MDANTYAAAGVNIEQAERFVDRLKSRAKRPEHQQLWKGAGGYASVVPIDDELAMALTTDGVGTKLLVALEFDQLKTIGIDLVAMCANDLVCVGATPLSFLDYYATPKLDDKQADAIIDGIVEGCDQAGILLVGGETAELPGLYAEKHFDLAGFAAGRVRKSELLTGEDITPGDTVIGVASTGIHSNGLSLARKVFLEGNPFREKLLVPTAIYVKPVVQVLQRFPQSARGIAHITGGGWRNLLRLNDNIGFDITNPLPLPPILKEMMKHVAVEEMYKTFNMGMGMALTVKSGASEIIEIFAQHGWTAQVVGTVTDRKSVVEIDAAPHVGSATKISLAE